MSLKEKILDGSATVGVVGLGYIGFSTAAYFANEGANVIGVDIDTYKVESFNKGRIYIDNIEFWLVCCFYYGPNRKQWRSIHEYPHESGKRPLRGSFSRGSCRC